MYILFLYIFRSVITEPWNLRMSWEGDSGHLVKCTCSINATNSKMSRAVSSQFLNIAGNTLTTVAQVPFVFFVTRVLAHVELGVQENPLVLLWRCFTSLCWFMTFSFPDAELRALPCWTFLSRNPLSHFSSLWSPGWQHDFWQISQCQFCIPSTFIIIQIMMSGSHFSPTAVLWIQVNCSVWVKFIKHYSKCWMPWNLLRAE